MLAAAATLASAVWDALLRRDGGGDGDGDGGGGDGGGALEGGYPAGGGMAVTGRLSLGGVMRAVRSLVITPCAGVAADTLDEMGPTAFRTACNRTCSRLQP